MDPDNRRRPETVECVASISFVFFLAIALSAAVIKPYVSDRCTVKDYDLWDASVGGDSVQEQPAEADRDSHG